MQTPAGSSDVTLQKISKHNKKSSATRLTPAIVRPVIEVVVGDYPDMGEYLGDTATIVCSPYFKHGLVKVMNGTMFDSCYCKIGI